MGNTCCGSSEAQGRAGEGVKSNSGNPISDSPSSEANKKKVAPKNTATKQQLIPDSEDEKLNITTQPSNTTSKNTTPNPDSSAMALAEQPTLANDHFDDKNSSSNNNNNNRQKGNEKVPLLEGPIDGPRYLIYKDKIIEALKSDGNTDVNIVKAVAKIPSNSDEKDEIVEQIIVTNKTSDGKELDKRIELTCSICMDDELTPSQLIEYTFDNSKWYLANICTDCNSYYRSTKFENWKHSIENETCEAAFRRMLNIGVITHIFDNVVFPSPEEEKHLYQVKDHKGKIVQIPRPVSAMRIWNPSKKKYEDVRARLDGAPDTEEELQELWQGMVSTFKTKYGKDLVVSWMNASTPGGPDDLDADGDLDPPM